MYIMLKLITVSILFHSLHSLTINPINQTCIEANTYTVEYSPELSLELPFFNLPPFSQSIIEIDLRHLESIPLSPQNESCFEFRAIIVQKSGVGFSGFRGLGAAANRYVFYVDQDTRLGLYFDIKEGYQAYKYLLLGSVGIKIVLQNWRIPQESSSFLFIISSLDSLNLPANRPSVDSYSGYYINKILSDPLQSASASPESANSYWTTFTSLAIPFIPYISNCRNEGSKMYLSQLMESQADCNLVEVADTMPIDQFKFGSLPKADVCKIKRECVYDQVPGVSAEFPYWLTLPQGSAIFSITQNKVSYEDYQISNIYQDKNLVECKINQSKGSNTSSEYPLNVKLTLEYYQQTPQTKKMIACTITFSLYMQSSPNFTYQFELETKPLNHTYIMLAFGFEWYVYMIVFVIIGLISNLENLVLWLFHACVSGKARKEFRIRIYLRIILEIGKGTLIALLLCLFGLFAVNLIMNAKIFDRTLYGSQLASSTPRVFWDYLNSNYINDYDSPLAVKFRSGRMGLSFLVTGSVILFYTSKFFIGCEKKKKQYDDYQIMGRELKPRQWNRGKFLFGTYIYICIQFFFIYFAYSTIYSQNIWTFIVLMKIIQIIMQEITLSIYEDSLPCLPLKVITDITAYMNTLSADNLYDFLFSFLIDVAITMIEKAYVPQLQNIVVDKIHQKMTELFRFYAHLINDTEGEVNQAVEEEVEQLDEENQFVMMSGQLEELRFFDNEEPEVYNDDAAIDLRVEQIKSLQKQISHKLLLLRRHETKQYSDPTAQQPQQPHQQTKNRQQKLQQSSIIFQILLDNVLLFFTFLLQPFVVLVFWITYDESRILSNYGISYGVVILYLLSAIVIAFFTIINMIMIFHLLESYLEVDFQQIIERLLGRFLNRTVFWKACDQDINTEIHTAFRGADHYCLSWQFFFILALYVSSMVLVMLGFSILIDCKHNPFNDTATGPVVLFWLAFTVLCIWLIQKLAYCLNIDNWKDFEENSRNANAVADFSVKEEINVKGDQEQGTNQQLISETSQQELIGSTMLLRKSRKDSQPNSFKILSNTYHENSNQEQNESSSTLSQQTLHTKIQTICKKLQPKFQSNKFNSSYFQKNKQFLKQNIERILPLLDQLPQISKYRIPAKELTLLDSSGKKEYKTYDTFYEEVINVWRYRAEGLQRDRQRLGRDYEQRLMYCAFCFEPWGVYYGYGSGICLKCSQQLNQERKRQ